MLPVLALQHQPCSSCFLHNPLCGSVWHETVLTCFPPETTNGAGAEEKKGDAPETVNQANGNNDSTDAEQTKPTEDTAKPAEEVKAPEEAESTAPESKEPAAADKTDESKVGDKREHDTTSAPTAKKQKTDEDTTKAENDTSGDANGEKKKSGRPKKTKEAAKKDIPTDGIGSRTRSRTKAT